MCLKERTKIAERNIINTTISKNNILIKKKYF